MTRKDYTLIALALFASQPASFTFASRSPEEEQEVNVWQATADAIAVALYNDNPDFNQVKFTQRAMRGK